MTLEQIHTEILALRVEQRRKAARWLRGIRVPALTIAEKFSEAEWFLMVVAYDCVAWSWLRTIDVDAADTEAGEEDYRGAFSQTLASFLLMLAGDYTDVRFSSLFNHYSKEDPDSAPPVDICDTARRVQTLDAHEAVALHVLLEAARAVGPALQHYGNWWHPSMMLRLLDQPEYDWPSSVLDMMGKE